MVPGKRGADTDAAQIAAIGMLLDRAYGKAMQPLTADGERGQATILEVRWAPAIDATPAIEHEPASPMDATEQD